MGAGTLNLGDCYTGNHCYMAIHWSLTPLFEVDCRSSWNKGIEQGTILQRTPFRTILCLNHETLIRTYVHNIISGSWVIARIRFYWTKFRVTVVYVIRITFIRRRSDYIIGFVTPAIGPNKFKKLTWLIAKQHTWLHRQEVNCLWSHVYCLPFKLCRVDCVSAL